jgi:methylated-DNA-[protein]-cysteine S-methyltransferase
MILDKEDQVLKLENKVYKKLLEVPKGKVTTYGELAKAVGLKNGQRVIGRIMSKNPYPVIVPCHRVIKSNGKVGNYAYGTDVKTAMLSKEGINIKKGKISEFKKNIHRF